MQQNSNDVTKPEKALIRKRIGNTVYAVSVHFSEKSAESMADKILRLARLDAESIGEAAAK